MPDPIRVVLADDHYLVREGTRQLLELDGQAQVVDAVGDVDALLAAVEVHAPDVVFTDVRMPPTHAMEGIEGALELRARYPALGVVVLSNHADPDYALALFAGGTSGLAYLLKERVGDRGELLRAAREVVAGRSVVDPVVVEALVARSARSAASPVAALSPREREVLEQMAAGLSNPAIGQRLHLSTSSVEKNVNAIFTKMGLPEDPATHRRVAAVLAFLSARD